jgi:hypothetical protein
MVAIAHSGSVHVIYPDVLPDPVKGHNLFRFILPILDDSDNQIGLK